MISCFSHHPRVLLPQGHICPLSRAWINTCLQQAAVASNQPSPWWPADMVIDGLMLWIEEQDWQQPLALTEVQKRLQSALDGIGYPEIAQNLHLSPPPLRINLLHIAQDAGELFELEFFPQLNAQLEAYQKAGFESFCFTHLEECTDVLCGQARRTVRWKQLYKELHAFLETRLQKLTESVA